MLSRVSVSLEELVLLKAEARGFSFLPRQPVASLLSGRHASRLRGRGLSFDELRHYHEGDDIRAIDWRATARLRSPHIRVYTEERERPVVMVVDQRRPMFFGSRRAMKSVAAAEIAAIGAWRALQGGDRVGGIVFNEDEMVELRPHRSEGRVLRLLDEVVRFNRALVEPRPSSGQGEVKVTLDRVLEAAARQAKHDNLLVLVSDLDGAGDETERLASRLAAHNDVLVIAVYDPLGATLQGRPGMVASTPDGAVPVPSDPGFEPAFRREFERVLGRWREVFRALKVPVLPLSTAEPAGDQLRALFGSGRGRAGGNP